MAIIDMSWEEGDEPMSLFFEVADGGVAAGPIPSIILKFRGNLGAHGNYTDDRYIPVDMAVQIARAILEVVAEVREEETRKGIVRKGGV